MNGQKMIRGYQWGEDGSYIGVYEFPDNLDREAVHLPPNTTMQAPPSEVPAGQEAAWDNAAQAWVVRVEDLSWMDVDSRTRMLAHHSAQATGSAGQNVLGEAAP